MKVPYLDLAYQHSVVRDEAEEMVLEVLRSGSYILGETVSQFESLFADYIGTPYAIGVSNGTDGLKLALQAVGVGPGDEVIAPLHTFKATVAAILAVQATPVLVDISPELGYPPIEHLLEAVTPQTKAILPVHMHGHPYPVDELLYAIHRENVHVAIVEDASQAHGAHIQGRKVGTFGDVGVFSLYPGKNLGAAGDAGVCVTSSDELAQRMRKLRSWEDETSLAFPRGLSWNCRLDEIQGAILLAKLRHLDEWNAARVSQASHYQELLPMDLVWPDRSEGSVYHHFVCLVGNRDGVRTALEAQGIGTGVHYASPLSQSALIHGCRLARGSTHADRVAKQTISLPVGPHLTGGQVDRAASTLMSILQSSV